MWPEKTEPALLYYALPLEVALPVATQYKLSTVIFACKAVEIFPDPLRFFFLFFFSLFYKPHFFFVCDDVIVIPRAQDSARPGKPGVAHVPRCYGRRAEKFSEE